MNVALVKHAQHDIYRSQRRQNQYRLIGQRSLKRLRGSLEAAVHRCRQIHFPLGGFDLFNRVPE